MPEALNLETSSAAEDITSPGSLLRDLLGVEDPQLRVYSEFFGEHTVLSRLGGALDSGTCWRLERETALMLSEPFSRWVLDLSELHFLGLSGLRVLRELSERIAVTGAALSMFGARLQPRRALALVDELHRRMFSTVDIACSA